MKTLSDIQIKIIHSKLTKHNLKSGWITDSITFLMT